MYVRFAPSGVQAGAPIGPLSFAIDAGVPPDMPTTNNSDAPPVVVEYASFVPSGDQLAPPMLSACAIR